MKYQALEKESKRASSLLKALANEKRLAILCHLSRGEHAVGELSERVDLSQSALSQHLAKLRRDRLVATRRDAQTIYYSLRGEWLLPLLDRLQQLFGDEGRSSHGAPGSAANGSAANGSGSNCEPSPAE
jgi:DNA-binding transcriptional ArsR family regulator